MAAGNVDAKAHRIMRHRLSTRIWHGINALTILVMFMSGLMIFNAHPRLYWGEFGANYDPAWLQIGSGRYSRAQGGQDFGFLQIANTRIETTGVLGLWKDPQGQMQTRAFPYWITLPSRYSLAGARIWHLAFAWVLSAGLALYLLWSLVNGHLRRDIHITRKDWRWRSLWRDIKEHARLRFPKGEAALRYSVLQKLAYAVVLFILLPLIIATGLAMSPGTDAWMPALTHALGGRQTARSIHFLCAFGLVGFFIVHMAMVLVSGPFRQIRAIVTGRMRIDSERAS